MNVINFRIKGAFLYNGNELPDYTTYVNGSCLNLGPPCKKGSMIMVERKDDTATFPFVAYAEIVEIGLPRAGREDFKWNLVDLT